MKRLTLTSGILFLGMSLVMGRTADVTEMPPVVEVVTSNQAQTQVEPQRNKIWYHQMRQAVLPNAKSVAKTEESQPLFSCTFDTEEDFTNKWTATDGEGDGKTWRYASEDGNGYVKSTSIDDEDGELDTEETADYMMTNSAVAMPAGKAYVAFKYAFGEDMSVTLKVYYGASNTADPDQMTLIDELSGKGEGSWSDKTMAFTVEEAGDYYFCFLHSTEDDLAMGGGLVKLDNVEIHAGEVPSGEEPGGDDPVADAVAKPEFSIPGGEVELNTKVTISCATSGAEIYYTTDGTTPDDFSTLYTDGVVIDKAMTVKAIAYSEDDDVFSEVAEASYTIKNDNTGGDEPGDDEPGSPLFVCTFESEDDFADKWTVSDKDGDGKTWRYVNGHDTYYPALDGSFNNGYAQSVTIYDEDDPDIETSDYMMTKAAVHMPAGKAYVAFNYALGSWNPVHLKVYYSKTPNTELSGMTLVGELQKSEKYFDKDEEAWLDTAMAFTLTEDGDYYFCFVHCSKPDEWGFNLNGLYIDNLVIGSGRYEPTPELKIEHVILPLSSCALGTAEPVMVRIKSVGSATLTKVSLSYKVNDGEAVTEDFAVSLAPSKETFLEFTQKADFSEAGQIYTVSVSGTVEGETDMTNNKDTACVTHFTPVETMPFVINTNEETGRNQLGFDSEAWTYSEVHGFGNWFADPLVTRCMALKGGETYRFSFDRRAGVDLGIMQLPESFWVVYAPAGSEDWDILKFYEADYTYGASVHDELFVVPAADGSYSFGIVPDANCCNASLFISRIEVEAVGEHDVVIADMMTSLARRTPAVHAAAPMFDIMVVNRGLNDENVKVVLKHGDEEIGSSSLTLKKSDTGYCQIQGKLGIVKTGEVTLSVEAGLTATDATPENNKVDWTFVATDSLYAFDMDMVYERAMTSKYVIGEIFTLAEPDTLSSLILGWFPLEESIAFGVEIYPVEEDLDRRDYYKAGQCLFSQEFNRQAEGGLESVAMGIELPAGRYLIGLKRLTPSLLHVGFDEQPEGKFYMLYQDVVYPNVEYGYLALRAVFRKTKPTGNEDDWMWSQLKSYPNPVAGWWTVEAQGQVINRIEISNMTGGVVYRSADKLSAETWSVNMAGFKPGLYVARVYTDSGVRTVKVMVR